MGANGDFGDETLDVAKVCAYNEAKIAAGGNVEPDAFESPTKDDEVRFFDVGEKEVVRLRFAAPTAETTAPTLGAPSILRERRNGFLARESAFRRFCVLLGASRRRFVGRRIFKAAARAGRVGAERSGAGETGKGE